MLTPAGDAPPEEPPAFRPDVLLCAEFTALASAPRLEILRRLRAPKALGEIEVPIAEEDARGSLSRQAIRKHLDVLLGAGLVKAREAERGYGPTTEYVVDPRALFTLAEEVRELALLRPTVELHAPTSPGSARPAAPPPRPALVLVKGLREGAAFPLSGRTRWVIGRRRSAEVSLEYDPAVSGENSLVLLEDGRHVVQDLPGSRNGTRLNFRPLAPGEKAPLSHGDLVGVGRSLLLYWA